MTATRPIQTRADLHGRNALVLGLARSGVAAARFLSDAGAVVTAYDRRGEAVASLGERPIELALGVPEAIARQLIDAADVLVTSPSISPRFPTTEPWLRDALSGAEARGVELVSEVELFLRLTEARILAVTGTKGKTTTTALLGSILAAGEIPHVVGGNIGEPLVERSEELGAGTWAVLELSELQLPTISRGDRRPFPHVTHNGGCRVAARRSDRPDSRQTRTDCPSISPGARRGRSPFDDSRRLRGGSRHGTRDGCPFASRAYRSVDLC